MLQKSNENVKEFLSGYSRIKLLCLFLDWGRCSIDDIPIKNIIGKTIKMYILRGKIHVSSFLLNDDIQKINFQVYRIHKRGVLKDNSIPCYNSNHKECTTDNPMVRKRTKTKQWRFENTRRSSSMRYFILPIQKV